MGDHGRGKLLAAAWRGEIENVKSVVASGVPVDARYYALNLTFFVVPGGGTDTRGLCFSFSFGLLCGVFEKLRLIFPFLFMPPPLRK